MTFQLIQDSKWLNDLYLQRRDSSLDVRRRVNFFSMAHVRATCRTCGNPGYIVPFMDVSGGLFFVYPDICDHCNLVKGDYDEIYGDEEWEEEEWEEEDEYHCPDCGREGWLCECDEELTP